MSLGMPTNKKAPVRRLFEPEPFNSDYIVNLIISKMRVNYFHVVLFIFNKNKSNRAI